MEESFQAQVPQPRANSGLKPLWITLGIFGFLCCGGLILIGTLIWRGSGAVQEALAYGDSSLLAIGKKWDPEALIDRMSPHWTRSVPDAEAQVKQACSQLSSKLGPIKSTPPASRVLHIGAYTNTQVGSHTLVRYLAEAEFEKAWGTVEMQLIKQESEWKIYRFDLRPGRQ